MFAPLVKGMVYHASLDGFGNRKAADGRYDPSIRIVNPFADASYYGFIVKSRLDDPLGAESDRIRTRLIESGRRGDECNVMVVAFPKDRNYRGPYFALATDRTPVGLDILADFSLEDAVLRGPNVFSSLCVGYGARGDPTMMLYKDGSVVFGYLEIRPASDHQGMERNSILKGLELQPGTRRISRFISSSPSAGACFLETVLTIKESDMAWAEGRAIQTEVEDYSVGRRIRDLPVVGTEMLKREEGGKGFVLQPNRGRYMGVVVRGANDAVGELVDARICYLDDDNIIAERI